MNILLGSQICVTAICTLACVVKALLEYFVLPKNTARLLLLFSNIQNTRDLFSPVKMCFIIMFLLSSSS